jgi:hypothetical protein
MEGASIFSGRALVGGKLTTEVENADQTWAASEYFIDSKWFVTKPGEQRLGQ